jgi:hypothetical protein
MLYCRCTIRAWYRSVRWLAELPLRLLKSLPDRRYFSDDNDRGDAIC